MSPVRRERLRGRRGFTMTEMLVALFLASVGMVTVFGIQVAANVVQRQSRDINAARTLAESFMTRLRGETVNWTTPGVGLNCNATDMPLCDHAVNNGAAGTWVAVDDANGNGPSPRYSALGIPDDPTDDRIISGPTRDRMNGYNLRYCIHYNLSLVEGGPVPGELMRAHVRVFWPLTDEAFAPVAQGGIPDCGFSDPEAMALATDKFRFVQITSVLYRHEDLL